MKKDGRIAISVSYILLGAVLAGLGVAGIVDEYWSGMGAALFVMGVMRLLRIFRFQRDEAFREKVETETKDERNQFLRGKAWASAGVLFVVIAAAASIVFKVLGKDDLSSASGWAVCLIVTLYWVSFLILRKKY